jgi:hypothetical protein
MAGNRNLSSKRLYVAIAAWLVLVVVGGLCTWYGWFGAQSGSEQEAGEATPAFDLTATAVAQATEATPTAPPTAKPSTPDAAAPTEEIEGEFGYGIAGNFVGGGDPAYWMGQVESLGLGWVKQQVRWADFSPAPGEMDWSGFDAVIEEANRRDIKVMFSVVDAPDWAHSYVDDNPEGAPPDDLNEFADFLTEMVQRYKGRLHAIEVWNEQNLDREWDTPEGVNAEHYVEMLRVAYQAIKSQDPDVMVISGALSPTAGRQTDPNNPDRVIWMDDFDYMDQMIEAGFLDHCDCVGAHHNGINMPPNVEWDEGYDDPDAQFRGPFDDPHHSWSFKSTLWGYHERIQSAGSDKPLCVTEFGWATAEGFDGHPPGFEFALDNTLQEQAEWNVQAFKLMRKWGFVRLAFLWNLNYSQLGWGPEDPNAPYAIIDFNGAGRPAFGAIGTMDKP